MNTIIDRLPWISQPHFFRQGDSRCEDMLQSRGEILADYGQDRSRFNPSFGYYDSRFNPMGIGDSVEL